METLKDVTDAIVDKAKEVYHQVADRVWGPTDKDVLNVLRQDHRLVASLFEQLDFREHRDAPSDAKATRSVARASDATQANGA